MGEARKTRGRTGRHALAGIAQGTGAAGRSDSLTRKRTCVLHSVLWRWLFPPSELSSAAQFRRAGTCHSAQTAPGVLSWARIPDAPYMPGQARARFGRPGPCRGRHASPDSELLHRGGSKWPPPPGHSETCGGQAGLQRLPGELTATTGRAEAGRRTCGRACAGCLPLAAGASASPCGGSSRPSGTCAGSSTPPSLWSPRPAPPPAAPARSPGAASRSSARPRARTAGSRWKATAPRRGGRSRGSPPARRATRPQTSPCTASRPGRTRPCCRRCGRRRPTRPSPARGSAPPPAAPRAGC
mmetsp:Transcript_77324/g.201522  ORF Transcript_77324/g.201522 Transcript_77324/m.201522 type:complete len:299 (+) Transcript_77324:110-1006(+)